MPEGDRAEEESWDPIADGSTDEDEAKSEDEAEREVLREEDDESAD
jgi:hypothetical protein